MGERAESDGACACSQSHARVLSRARGAGWRDTTLLTLGLGASPLCGEVSLGGIHMIIIRSHSQRQAACGGFSYDTYTYIQCTRTHAHMHIQSSITTINPLQLIEVVKSYTRS